MPYPVLDAPISPLRQRLIDDMNMRRFSSETQRNYLRDIGRLIPAQDAPRRASPAVSKLPDGRVVAARMRMPFGPAGRNPFGYLALIAGVIGLAAFPVVRHLTRRLEALRQGVDRWGEGALDTRVALRGNDEVAAVAASFNRAAEQIEQLLAAHRSLLAHNTLARAPIGTAARRPAPNAALSCRGGRLTVDPQARTMRCLSEKSLSGERRVSHGFASPAC